MNTKHFKDSQNNTFGLDTTSENWESFIKEDWIEITIEEAQAIANPPPSQIEIDLQKEKENIAFLASESERTESEIKVYERMRDRNRADEDDLAMLEALEDYSIDLKKVTKQKGWPLEVEWPVAPRF
ncbi:phage tail assembly chaperone [Wohlfahrtiimonas larvae]|uniref:Phage tail protein n=1 Tax=Wohlfahrtiimonas larvae TaxID=1157986 RepID=A0ABP9N203_9GAMM|nr:phage tail assembly chaperone [Wohlfahrtiimonas larvae]